MKTTKRNLLFAAVAAMVLGFAVSATAANGNLVQDSGGYYLIDDYADLKAFANKVNAGDTFISCKLTTDIAATDTAWTPIATNEYKSYNGSFEGQGHTITGLNNAGARDDLQFAGLVGVMGIAGVVRNVRVVGGNMALSTTRAYVGGLVGYLLKGTVENCIFSGSATCSTWGSGQSSGGIVGYQTRGLVRNCHSTASLKGYHAGGIVGYMDEGTVATCCFNGYRPPDTNYQNFGAIAGKATQATLTHCYYDAQKAAPGIGQNNGSSDSTVVGLLTRYFTDPVDFAGFDFGTIWYMGDSGPMLRYLLEKYPYADPADGAEPVKTTACIPITESTTTLHSHWYVANSSVAVNGRIVVHGDANLILGDGCVLRAYAGIELAGANRLTVWCQSGGSGTLVAYGYDDDAAIGGNGYRSEAGSPTIYAQPGGTVTIHGGTVTATARGAGAGIGGGGVGSTGSADGGDGGTVRIYGGTVRAVSEGAGAGIGGGGVCSGFSGFGSGDGGKGGTVILKDGMVTAGSEDGGVAIGGGQGSEDDADGALCFAGSLGVVAAQRESNLASLQPVARAERAAACHSNKWAKVSPCQQDHGSLAGPCPVCGRCPPVSYIDPADQANPEKTRTDCFGVFDDTEMLASGWYAPAGNLTLTHRLAVDGDVKLILVDGATLTAEQGIRVSAGDSLTIFGQSGHSGELVAMNSGDAAIGDGLGDSDAGRLAIDGMRVFASASATESVAAAQRESVCRSAWARLVPCADHNAYDMQGRCLACGLVVGPVSYLNPTMPGSPTVAVSNYVLITNQTALATGWHVVRDNAQIGTRIEVTGDVNLILCDGAELTAAQGFRVTGANRLTIWGQSANRTTAGKLTSRGVVESDAGIGGSYVIACGTVTINGGELTVSGGKYGAGIGGGGYARGGTVTINGGFVTATGGSLGAGIGGGAYNAGGTVTINGGEVTAVAGMYAQAIGHGDEGGNAGSLAIDGMRVFASPSSAPVAAADRVGVCRSGWAKLEVCPHMYSPEGVCLYCGKYIPYAGQTVLAGGFYEVEEDLTVDGRIEVLGDVTLLLCDEAELTVAQGFHVTGTNSLTICGQSTDRATAGKLTVNGAPNRAAGIGGNDRETGGGIMVNGGVLTVIGGLYGAGIGGGEMGNGGKTTVNGGFVTANGGGDGAGIGGGAQGDGGTITIAGGFVTAKGRSDGGAGIGGGFRGAGGQITITGGTVTSTGGFRGAGIGGGVGGNGGAITINGGTVTAIAGTDAQAIDHGSSGDNTGSLDIDGMRVFASADATEPVAAAQRVGVCRSGWAKLEVCPHGSDSGVCPWCGPVLAYAAWASTNNVAGAWNATDGSGIHNVFRYAFDKPRGAFTSPPLLSISFDALGRAVIHTPPLVNGEGFDLSILATDDLNGSGATTYPLDAGGETTIPATNSPARFFRLEATEE